jgi:hypothetical protein
MPFTLPTLQQRAVVIGKTGTGKTFFGLWLLSRARYDVQPFVIIDYKHDELIGKIAHARVIKVGTIPRQPGIYIVRPLPHENDAVEAYLWEIWRRGGIGVFCDEATLLPKPYQPGAVRSIFVQGRSKRIPVIACTQRPSGISPYTFSEADFFAVFHLQKPEDRASIAAYTPWSPREMLERLPPHWCRWYDSPRDFATTLKPCPDEAVILQTFEDRLKPRRRFF